MSKEELLNKLNKLKNESKDYSHYALMNEGYGVAIIDAIDLVEKLTLPNNNQQRELLTDKVNRPKFPENRITNNTSPIVLKKKG